MTDYEQIARNLYTDKMKADSGADMGFKQYLDHVHKSADPRDYGVIFYSNVLIAMSRSELSHLKPALAKMVFNYCHEMITSIPLSDQKGKKTDLIPLVIMHYYLYKTGGQAISMNNAFTLAGRYKTTTANILKQKREWWNNARLTNFKSSNANAVDAHIRNFTRAIELLRKEDYKAARLAESDFALLKSKLTIKKA